jgi:hypothetical protein
MIWWLQLLGLLLGFLGALFVTIAQQPGGGVFEGRPGGEVAYLALEYPRLWKVGLWLLCAGFVFQGASLFFPGAAR